MAVEGHLRPQGASSPWAARHRKRPSAASEQNRGGSIRSGRFSDWGHASIANCTADRPCVNGAVALRYMADALADRAADPSEASSALSISSKVRPLGSYPNTQKPIRPSTYHEAK